MTISFGSLISENGVVTIDPLLTQAQLGNSVGDLSILGSVSNHVTVPGSYPYTVLSSDNIIAVSTSSTANTVNLPASPTTGNTYIIKDATGNAATHNITVSGNGNNIDGASTFVMNVNYEGAVFVFGATQWGAVASSGSGGGSGITTVGDVTSGTVAFDGTIGTTLTSTTAGFTLTSTAQGSGNDNAGAAINITAGNSGTLSAGQFGGAVNITGGTGYGIFAGGAININPGTSGATSNGNSVNITAAASGSTTTQGGNVSIHGGSGGGTGGNVVLVAGNATTSGSPGGLTIGNGNASGTNQSGNGGFTINSGRGTGSGHVGQIFIVGDAIGTTGSTLHSQANRLIINGSVALTSTVASTIATMTLASGSSSGGTVTYLIECTDGTNYQAESGVVSFSAINKAGTKSGNASVIGAEALTVSAGTLTSIFSVTSGGLLQVTSTTSLTSTIFQITYEISCLSAKQTITIP